MDFMPNHPPDVARQRGRYVLENSQRVDLLVARVQLTVDGQRIAFEDLWKRKVGQRFKNVTIFLPTIEDLILTKRFGSRPKDAEDIRLLQRLMAKGTP